MVGEKIRSTSKPVGERRCSVCDATQMFDEHSESLWFCLFSLPLLPIEDSARYWRCEHCLTAYEPGQTEEPSSVPLVRQIVAYLLVGYDQYQQTELADEICLKLTGAAFEAEEMTQLVRDIDAGRLDVVDALSRRTKFLNAIGKQQIIEAAFLVTNACCDIQYEDRLRINQIGSAMGVGLEFVEYAIAAARKQNDYGIRRLRHIPTEV